jgi:hypothetical protein
MRNDDELLVAFPGMDELTIYTISEQELTLIGLMPGRGSEIRQIRRTQATLSDYG